MKAIIMAAGVGSRISAEIGNVPKSTLLFHGEPLIRTTVRKLLAQDIKPVVCVGFCKEKIFEALEGLDVEYCVNPEYGSTNNIYSLWLAQEFLADEDVILLSADIIFDPEILRVIAAAQGDFAMCVDSSRCADGDYFFRLSADGRIAAFGPQIPESQRSCEYMGISKISAARCADFRRRLNEYIESGRTHDYFERVILSFGAEPQTKIATPDVRDYSWREIDFYVDYQKALKEDSASAEQ